MLHQHIRVLKAMKHDCFNAFITPAAKINFNHSTMYEWQKVSHDCESVALYLELLKFLNL